MTHITRRTFSAGFGTAGLVATNLGLSASTASAQAAYPAGLTIKVVVPYPPGGATDIVGRMMADRLAAKWKTTVIVDNVPGAGANIGMTRVAQAPADGTSILIVPPNIATNPFLFEKMAFDAETAFSFLNHVINQPNLLCVRKDLAVNSVAELIAYCKANPGKLNYASSGVGTTIHLSAELFKAMAGVDITHIPYKGSPQAVSDLLGGQVDLMFDNLPSIFPHARSGAVKPLGITTATRSPTAPEFVPIAETVPGYDVASWFGIGVRTGTPQPIQDVIETSIMEACKEAVTKERFGSLHAVTIGSDKATFRAFVAAERARWGKLITELKIKPE
jgi:tripartite-type tricarboxylate transporter receptor subunit TctC